MADDDVRRLGRLAAHGDGFARARLERAWLRTGGNTGIFEKRLTPTSELGVHLWSGLIELVLVPEGSPGSGGTVLLLQKWEHDSAAWESLPLEEQEAVMGRTKLDSVELDDRPADSHAAMTDQDRFGKIFRRNMPYGTVTGHGTMFVGFSAEQRPLVAMLESMAGLAGGGRDALTRYTRALTGAYYFVPSAERLRGG